MERVVCAFILAGLAVFAVPKEGWAPNITKEREAVAKFMMNEPVDREMYDHILKSLREKGGITESDASSETVYKPKVLARAARSEALMSENPYYSKPEIILGKKFIQDNPEKAKEYMEKINTVLKSTVLIRGKGGFGSGAVIKTKKGKFILTNEHVVKNLEKVDMEFFEGYRLAGKVIAKDKKKDLALIKVDDWLTSDEFKINEPEGLEVENDPDVKKMVKGEKIAMTGNPLGYPYEVSVGEFIGVNHTKNFINNPREYEYTMICLKPDARFQSLARYDNNYSSPVDPFNRESKGHIVGGMSGGPIISLDEKGRPKLKGLNAMGFVRLGGTGRAADFGTSQLSGGVHSREITQFLEKNGYW